MKAPTEYLNRLTPHEREMVRLELRRLDQQLEKALRVDPPTAKRTRIERDAARRQLGLH